MENNTNKGINMDEMIQKYRKELVAYKGRSTAPADYLNPIIEQAAPSPVEAEPVLQSPAAPTPAPIPAPTPAPVPQSTSIPAPPAPPTLSEDQMTPEQQYLQFVQAHPARGKVKVETFTARRTFPVANATVEIAKLFPEGKYVIHTATTDNAGATSEIELPAPPRDLSEVPGSTEPYAVYNVTINHPDYGEVIVHNMPVFAEILSIQKIDLIPLSAIPQAQKPVEYTVIEPQL